MPAACARPAWLLLQALALSSLRHAAVQASADFAEDATGLFVERPDKLQRKLAWVISISPAYVQEYSHVLSSFNCYALWQDDVTLFIETETLIKGHHFFYERLRAIEKYLPHFQWVVHSDADVLVANFSMNPWSFVNNAHDVLFQVRDGRNELHAGMIFVKNSPGGRQFVVDWVQWSRQNGVELNYDNGDLHEVVLQTVGASNCSRFHMNILTYAAYFDRFLPCFWKNMGPFLVNQTQESVAFQGTNFSAKAFQMEHGFLQECESPNPGACSMRKLAVHSKISKGLVGRHLVQCRDFTLPVHRAAVLKRP